MHAKKNGTKAEKCGTIIAVLKKTPKRLSRQNPSAALRKKAGTLFPAARESGGCLPIEKKR